MAFEFHCRACGAKLRIDDGLAGQEVKCPTCGAVVPATEAPDAEPEESPFAGVGSAAPSTDEANPYASPASLPQIDVAGPAAEMQAITPGIHRAMSETRPWVLLLSVFAFIAASMMVLGCVAMACVAIAVQEAPIMLGAVFYLFYGGFGLGFGYYLFSYAKTIGVYSRSGQAADLETALVAQKSFWKLVGIFAIVLLAVMLLGGLFLAIIPLMMMGM
jgi:predicted Zn finger-like uncharacterized protein